jgi:osmotically-inducible protein OsmY
MNDKTLQARVEAELSWDPRLDATSIGVSAHDGVVTLSGSVADYSQKLDAQQAAMRVRGVHGIAENIDVRPFGDVGLADDEIARRALSSLEWDVMVPDKAIQLVVEDGYVTLTGEVDWEFQRAAAARALHKLYGVRQITNEITLKSRIQSGDVQKLIKDALERQGQIEAGNIKVAIDGGKVSLTGHVKSWSERSVIEHAAWAAPGVYAVHDKTTVAA